MKIKSIKNVLMVMLLTVLAFLYVGTTKTSAQITDEKDIPKGYTPIYTIEDLYGINNNLEGKYILMADIDMSATQKGEDWDFGYGWRPIGYNSETSSLYDDYGYYLKIRFYGILDGNGHRIINLSFHGDVPYAYVGLFAENQGDIVNLGLENISIDLEEGTSFIKMGAIAASNNGMIERCYVTGVICANNNKGIIGGITNDCTGGVSDCYTNVEISANNAGGLFGYIEPTAGWKERNCYSIGNIIGEKISPISPSGEKAASKCYYLKSIGESKYSTALSSAQMKLQGCYTGFDFEKVWFIDKNSSYPYPQLRSCPQVRIESVKISSKPNKTSYGVKDDLDLTGATLVVNYEDNYSVEISVEKSMCSYKMAKGVQTVTVDYFGAKASFDIEVGMEKEVLTVTSQTSNMVVGESFGFAADYNGSESIQFSSSNPKVLSINKKTGDAKAIKVGTAVVTISAGSLTKEIEVTVSKTADERKTGKETKENKKTETITEDTVEPDFEMEIGESFKLAIKKIKSRNLASSDATVVTINEKGKVVAVAPGVATITATDKKTNKVAESYVILVVGEEEPDFEIEVNESVRIAMKKGYTVESSNEKYVTVSKKGIIFGAKAGTATITVYDKTGKEVDQYNVKVTK